MKKRKKTKTEIGIIGFGQFGQFAAQHLRKNFKVFVSDKSNKSSKANKLGMGFSTIKKSASRDIVILATPISEIEKTLKKIKPFLKKNALLLDVCSVKENPIRLMDKIVPKNVDILGTHPLFGPQSGKNGIKGLKIVLCPVRINKNKLNKVKRFLKRSNLQIITTTPVEHDKQMAKCQAITFFVGKILNQMGVKEQTLTTKAFEHLLGAINLHKEDSLQLFKDMQNTNRFAPEIRERFVKEVANLNSKFSGRN